MDAAYGDKMGFEDQHIFNQHASRFVAGTLAASGAGTDRPAGQGNELDFLVPVAHSLRADGFDASEDGTGRGTPIIAIQDEATRGNPQSGPGGKGWRNDGAAFTHQADHVQAVLPVAPVLTSNYGKQPDNSDTNAGPMLVAHTLRENYRNNSDPAAEAEMHIYSGMAVRRLTPRECERLQGFPDDYTLVTYRKKPAADGPRYKALGNSMAVNCMRWIGMRLAAVERITSKAKAGAA